MCIKLLHPSEFLKDKYIDKVKNNNLVKNLIHHSLEKNLNEKMLICHYCNTINEFIFNKKLSNNYIFIFDKKFDYQHPLFLENNEGKYFIYENNEIKNNFILSQMA